MSVANTKELIKDTIERLLETHSFDDLTVKLVCNEAGISKQTLYNHYYSLMHALEDLYRRDFYNAVKDCDTYYDWVEGFRCFLEFLYEKKTALLHVYFSSRRDELIDMIYRNGRRLIEKAIRDCSKDIEVNVSDKDCEFMLDFYMDVFMGIVRKYFKERMNEDPAYIASRCDAMMRFNIRNTLRNIHDLESGLF